jgi:quinolinate synthase
MLAGEIIEKIAALKRQRRAVILAHNYQIGEVQDIADFTGDSLGLSIEAAKTDAETIVFCGVRFMAETAAILSPEKTVLLPEATAGCPMADMIDAKQLAELKKRHPAALVVCYVNTTAEVKALSDYCCTSSNALQLVRSLPADREIIFVPDRNLGQYIVDRTGREMILWPGYCLTHARITAQDVAKVKAAYPDAVVMSHPECGSEVRACSDELLSTGQMLKFAAGSARRRFIVVTEIGIIHSLKKANPGKEFIPVSDRAVCPNMKKITLEKVLWSLQDMQHRVTVPEDIRVRARLALDRMLEVIPK